MHKEFAVDFWVKYIEGDDPDRTEFSHSRKALEELAERITGAGKEYNYAVLHKRKKPEPKDDRWKPLDSWPK